MAGPVEAPQPTRVRVESWHDEQRLSNLSVQERQSLAQLQASQPLEGHAPLTRGRLRGLFNIAGRYYVKLGDDVYEVIETWNGMQIIGPEPSSSEWVSHWDGAPDGYHIVGRERQKGPWLTLAWPMDFESDPLWRHAKEQAIHQRGKPPAVRHVERNRHG